jgi:hypothetical protein
MSEDTINNLKTPQGYAETLGDQTPESLIASIEASKAQIRTLTKNMGAPRLFALIELRVIEMQALVKNGPQNNAPTPQP